MQDFLPPTNSITVQGLRLIILQVYSLNEYWNNVIDREELKKISSKPFSTKSKQKKTSANLEESAELNQSSRSTNLDASNPHLSTPARDMYASSKTNKVPCCLKN